MGVVAGGDVAGVTLPLLEPPLDELPELALAGGVVVGGTVTGTVAGVVAGVAPFVVVVPETAFPA